MELTSTFDPSPFDQLNPVQYELLTSFLRNKGNLKAVQSDLHLSYPSVKKKLDDLLIALNLCDAPQKKEREEIDMRWFKIDHSSREASEIIKAKLKECGGHATVYTARGLPCEIYAEADGKTFTSEKLPITPAYEYDVFNVVVDLLKKEGGRAKKGNGRGNKLGQPGCEENTVVGAVAKSRGYHAGESVYDPVFVLAAVLEWAGIVKNGRGELILTPEYQRLP